MDEIKVPHLRSSAVVNLSLGTVFIGNIQGSLHYMTESMTAEDKEQFTARVESGQPLDGRDLVIYTLSALSMNIFQEARQTDQIEYKDLGGTLGL